jgi:hypothetical protein
MPKGDKTWRQLAFAFYAVAHNDFELFEALPQEQKDSEVGRLCQQYMRNKDSQLLDQAGYLLTGTKEWYVYIGRC